MKTKYTFLKCLTLIICIGGFTTMQAQGLYNLATLDEEYGSSPLKWTAGIDYGYDDDVLPLETKEALEKGIEWNRSTIGVSAGFGWDSNDDFDTTTFCLGAEYQHKIMDRGARGAGYLGAFANYHNSSIDDFKENIYRAGAKFSYYDPIDPFNKVQLVYGANVSFETGNREINDFEDDITGCGASLYSGLNWRVNNKFSLGFEFPIVSHWMRTFEFEGGETEQKNTSIAINKNNPLMAYARWNLGRGKN